MGKIKIEARSSGKRHNLIFKSNIRKKSMADKKLT